MTTHTAQSARFGIPLAAWLAASLACSTVLHGGNVTQLTTSLAHDNLPAWQWSGIGGAFAPAAASVAARLNQRFRLP